MTGPSHYGPVNVGQDDWEPADRVARSLRQRREAVRAEQATLLAAAQAVMDDPGRPALPDRLAAAEVLADLSPDWNTRRKYDAVAEVLRMMTGGGAA